MTIRPLRFGDTPNACQTHGENGHLQETSFPQGRGVDGANFPRDLVREM